MQGTVGLELIARLSAIPSPSWGERALLACLEKLRDGGPTEWHLIEVFDASAFSDGFEIVYRSPWGPRVGLRVSQDSIGGDPPTWFQCVYSRGDEPTPEEFGMEIADFAVAEPLGRRLEELPFDASGLGWWGEPPLPTSVTDAGRPGG